MLRTQLTLLIIFASYFLNAQTNSSDSLRMASVSVLVTDMKGKPTKGEQILFRNAAIGKIYGGRSDAQGRFAIALPIGNKYVITVKSLTDSTRYGVIEIPSLGPDEEYTEPFKVNVKFEPAKSYKLDKVYFDFGKASLKPESFPELDEMVNYLIYREDVRVEIAGHTDNVGNDADNLKLSQQRAETIRQYAIKKGIAPARIQAKGYGATQPIADNSTDTGRQSNRRTEVRIL